MILKGTMLKLVQMNMLKLEIILLKKKIKLMNNKFKLRKKKMKQFMALMIRIRLRYNLR